jgi:hypothetical protein
MSKPFATYSTVSGELSSNPEAFEMNDSYVASIVWTKKVGDDVRPGDELATIQWSQDPDEPLIAPDGCAGEVKDINGNIRYNDLEYPPSQFLARIY